MNIQISFQAYIPKNLGKPLKEYFKNHPGFSAKNMTNYTEFKNALDVADRAGFKWIPEPFSSLTDYYCSTDDMGFHTAHNSHSVRLAIDFSIDSAKIGNYSSSDLFSLVRHKPHKDSQPGTQHSGYSHRVKAYIRKQLNGMYEGYCSDVDFLRAKERPLKISLRNTTVGHYIGRPGTYGPINSTEIKVSASANYPYMEKIAPNIDFYLEIILTQTDTSVEIRVTGSHNHFPAYELLIDRWGVYNYNPVRNGYIGPDFYNLAMATKAFSAYRSIMLDDWEREALKYKRAGKSSGYFYGY